MATGMRYARVRAQALLEQERGTLYRDAPIKIGLVYPSPYRAAMSSLGYQTMYRLLNSEPGMAAERAMLPDDVNAFRSAGAPLITLESQQPVGDFPVIAFSVAYELEIAGVVECLTAMGVPVLAEQRTHRHPLVIAGGPLTFSNPAPLAPFVDIIVLGEAEQVAPALIRDAAELGFVRERVLAAMAGRSGLYVPTHDGGRVPPIAAADDSLLPARSQIITPNTALSSMFLTEAARGCSRGCTYCVMRRSTNGGMRVVAPRIVLDGIPEYARRVGLVGAAVTDHPAIAEIVRGVVDGGREVGISSLRAGKLTDELVGLLAQGGYRTLTIAGDGASERMRTLIERRTTAAHLLRSAQLANKHGMHTVKVYMMVGVPGETDDDIDELIRFTAELRRAHPRIAYGIAPFVAKRNTPLDGTEFAGVSVVEARLARLRRGLRGKAEIRPTSARWAWVEYMIAQSGPDVGLAIMDAHRAGGRFADYKRAFAAHDVQPTGPIARVPSTSELIALRRAARARPTP